MSAKSKTLGFFLAGVAIIVWGATYVATKDLLGNFSALEI